MKNFKKILMQGLLLMMGTTLLAQESEAQNDQLQRADERSLQVGIGATNILDTYISQEEYTGTEFRVVGQSIHKLKNHPAWQRVFTHSGALAIASPRAENVDYLSGLYTLNLAYRHTWNLNSRWMLAAGGQAEGGVGFLYNTRNSNNPAQARIYLNVGPSAQATYCFPLFRKTIRLRYEVAAPFFGLLFSPNYGQSYYEIFSRGNYDHNIVPTTLFAAPTLRHSLVADIPFRHAALRVGYLGDYEQAEVNHLKYHTYSHLFIIGYVKNL